MLSDIVLLCDVVFSILSLKNIQISWALQSKVNYVWHSLFIEFDLRQIYIKYVFGNPELPMLLKVISTVYPQLTDLTRKLNFLLSFLKSTCSIYNLKTKLRTFPSISRVIRSKFEANRSRGSWVKIRQTNRQTNRDYNFIYI